MPSQFQEFSEEALWEKGTLNDSRGENWDLSSIESEVWEDDDARLERELLANVDAMYDNWENGTSWPTTRIAYPSVKFMVDSHAPIPKPLNPLLERQVNALEQYKKGRDTLTATIRSLKKKVQAAEDELRTEETKPKPFSQKWSERISGGPSNAVKHLKMELDKINQDYNTAKNNLERFEKTYSTIIQLTEAHDSYTKMYESYVKLEDKYTKLMWH